ncbi:hypothetical protein HPP92_023942 [Vanilla planifolia]|uniref:RING-type E3 ubiquitin transferase n=1 Tax=Vanilla planifolia TaxID=51239 RepID=A0A835PLJ3_VANPL|nr:hypothetical protein HPP92_023942 [Vanilla planifolia]
MTAVTGGFVLRRVTAFLEEVIWNLDERQRVLSAARRRLSSPADPATVHAISVLSDNLDTSSSSSVAAAATASAAMGGGKPSALSVLILSISLALRRRHADAARSLLDLFALDPTAARGDIAPQLFEELFLPHFFQVVRWFADRRSRVLSSVEEGGRVGATASMAILSRMSGGQATELRELERTYENVMDENSKVYAGYLKEVLRSGDGVRPPELVFPMADGNEDETKEAVEDEIFREAIGSTNERFNLPGGRTSFARAPSLYPQRINPQLLYKESSIDSIGSRIKDVSGSDEAFNSVENSDVSSSDPEPHQEEEDRKQATLQRRRQQQRQRRKSSVSLSSTDLGRVVADNFLASTKQAPPKDFVCPITNQLFDDPVTLETGQTYERRAIQEWLDRGNMTCPITRQKLHSAKLPKTNYVLKRLIASWQEENDCSTTVTPASSRKPSPTVARRTNPPKRSPSPTSVISQATTDGTTGDLQHAITCLCTSEVLSEAEMAVLYIERLWRETGADTKVLSSLSKPAVVNGFVEMLFHSVEQQVLRTTVFLLCELASRDKLVIQSLTRVDSDVEFIVALFKKGLVEAVVLIYLLRPSFESFLEMGMVEALLLVLKSSDDSYNMCLKPKAASILLLQQILAIDNKIPSEVIDVVVSEGVVESVIPSLVANLEEERMAAMRIIMRCMEVDGKSRHMIVGKVGLDVMLENFVTVSDIERFEIVRFLFELVKLDRINNDRLLHSIKDGGKFSMMHALLVYLQTALQDQSPIIAGLLLQLDILVEPRKASIYREEAIDALISCLRNPDFHNSQLLAVETILSLQGRFSSSGEPIVRALLLKRAGMKRGNRSSTGSDQINYVLDESKDTLEEERAAEEWERKMAFVLVSHEFGLLFETLAEGLKSEEREFFSACLVSASWLTYMLSILPDTGLRGAAKVCLLKHFVSILKSAKHADDKALAMLALRSFIQDSDGLHELTFDIKDIITTLRELKKSYVLAKELLKLFCHGKESCILDMWNHKVLVQVDCSMHGEVLSICYFKNRIISGHSDGTVKVWGCGQKLLHQVQETREHAKAVTSLAISPSGKKLFSGSIDKSLRVLTWNGGSKIINPNKYVKCLCLVQSKLYCGCNDNSIQEFDIATGTFYTIQSSNKKLLAKANPVYALEVQDGLIYSASSPLDGTAVKIWDASDYSQVGSLPSTLEVRCMAISNELIYLGSKTGVVEIWAKDKLLRVGALQIGTNCKVQCMAVVGDEVLVVGTSNGRLQAWGLT